VLGKGRRVHARSNYTQDLERREKKERGVRKRKRNNKKETKKKEAQTLHC
jgi:hypothetical protein